MAWNSPTLNETAAQYAFQFQHTNGKYLTLTVVGAAYLEDPEDYETAFEDAAAALDASPNFSFYVGERTTPSNDTYSL